MSDWTAASDRYYRQSIDNCLEAGIGASGLGAPELDAKLAESEAALQWLRDVHGDGSLPLLRLPARTEDMKGMQEAAAHLTDNTTDLFVLGTGGSSLGAQALAQLTGWGTQAYASPAPRIHFLDNLDATTMDQAFEACDLRTTRFLVVSKSGGTVETLMQMLAAMSRIEAAGGGKYMAQHFAVVTEPPKNGTPNALRRLAEEKGIPTFEHDPGVGGRFSVLTNVGLLPALLFGLDPLKVREGAKAVLNPILEGAAPASIPPAVGAAASLALAEKKGAGITVFMAYADRLERFIAWHLQLWAESLGKDGKGTTPVGALGPVDQHSQLQLYLAGPKDKMFTVFLTETAGKGPDILPAFTGEAPFDLFAGKRIGDLVDAEQRATADTLARNGRPVRLFHVPALTEESLGALLMHFMLETIIAGRMLGVDPFDQPAVEEGKILAKKYLTG